MKRCRVGDLAVIVRANSSRNLGKLVRIVERATPGAWFDPFLGRLTITPDGPDWRIESLSGLLECAGHESMYASIADYKLRPIRPDADPVETETEREATA